MGFFDNAKDLGVQAVINRMLGGIGSVHGLKIDRKARRITGRLELTGEPQPIEFAISGWEYAEDAQSNRMRVLALTTSRPWLEELANRALVNRWLDIPPNHMSKLRLALG